MNSRYLATFVLILSAAASAQDRMPPIPADQLTPAQKRSIELLQATPRGITVARGPFVPLLRSPGLLDRLQAVGEYLRFHNTIPQTLVEMTILMTARQWTQQYEWNAHYPLALKAGLKPEIIAAIAAGRHPQGMTVDEDMVYNFVTELTENKSVSDLTYDRLVKKFGEQGVIDTTGLVGYYSTLGAIMSVARSPAQSNSTAPSLAPFPH
jgi:4-carboxymuconolactone decarboxylase